MANMKQTAKAPGNIAFLKYWGKKDPKINIPENGSLSVCLDGIYSITTVEFSKEYLEDEVIIDGDKQDRELNRIINFLGHIRSLAGIKEKAKVISNNNFPKASGLASSASGFAALALAGSKAAGLDLSERELSLLARRGSGSATRSIPDGFVEWLPGEDDQSSYAYTLFPSEYWDLCAIITIITQSQKEITSTQGHARVHTSPFYQLRIQQMPEKIEAMKQYIKTKDIQKFGELLEEECLNFISISLTAKPYMLYLEPTTIRIMKNCLRLREEGLTPYYTMDAGPQPVIYCLGKDSVEVAKRLQELEGVEKTIICKPTHGARLVDSHLF